MRAFSVFLLLLISFTAQAGDYFVLHCKAPDRDYYPVQQSYSQNMFDTTLAQFWAEQSGGTFAPVVHSLPWVTLPREEAYYSTFPDAWAATMARSTDCINAYGENFIPDDAEGLFFVFNFLSRHVTAGSAAIQGKHNFLVYGEFREIRVAWMGHTDARNPSVYAHEWGHMLGLSHTQNDDGDFDSYDNPWSLMSAAHDYAVKLSHYDDYPKSLAAFERDKLGFILPENKAVINSEGEYLIDIAHHIGGTGNQIITVTLPGEPIKNRITIESKRKVGWDANLPANAVLVYEERPIPNYPSMSLGYILDTQTPAATFSNNDGSMITLGETQTYKGGKLSITVVEDLGDAFIIRVKVSNPIFSDSFE